MLRNEGFSRCPNLKKRKKYFKKTFLRTLAFELCFLKRKMSTIFFSNLIGVKLIFSLQNERDGDDAETVPGGGREVADRAEGLQQMSGRSTDIGQSAQRK